MPPDPAPKLVSIQLLPIGKILQIPAGTSLQDILFAHGVEFPCGGRGLCKGCKIRIIAGRMEPTAEDRHRLSPAEIEDGWRLACQAVPLEDLQIDLEQWEAAILSDETAFSFEPTEGLGVAVDLGTTTIVAQLMDLTSGHVLAVRSALNDQARQGADIMTRIEYAMAGDGQKVLETLVRKQIGVLVAELLAAGAPERARELKRVVLAGNTVMHHLFSGISVEPLSHYPFEPLSLDATFFGPEKLEWTLAKECSVEFLPCLGGFVGSDILAGILATRLHEMDEVAALVDLGTNGEIVVGNKGHMVCTSTAAGPAFEGATISMGMRAATGAISEVHIEGKGVKCHVLGNTTPRGICGSGLVDAAAAGLDLGWITPRGRLTTGNTLPLQEPVSLNQWDIRELQLAKGAIAAGLHLLMERMGVTKESISRVYLAGAFGNYVNQASARRIGLLDLEPHKIHPSGNTALLGAKLALFNPKLVNGSVLSRIEHVSLKEDPRFQEAYVEQMSFPSQPNSRR